MFLALILGLFMGEYAQKMVFLTKPVLAFMMLISFVFFDIKVFFSMKGIGKRMLSSLFFSYLLAGTVLFLLVFLLIPYNSEIYWGFLFIALAPPGVVIVPFAVLFKGDINYASIGVLVGSLFFIIVFPLVIFFFYDNVEIIIKEVFSLVILIIILPLILSRFLRYEKPFILVEKHRSILINWSFFIIIYIVIGINNTLFLGDVSLILRPTLVLFIFLFIMPFLIEKFLKRIVSTNQLRISQHLLFAVKNNGFSAVASLSIMGATAAVPSAILSVLLLFYLWGFAFIYKSHK